MKKVDFNKLKVGDRVIITGRDACDLVFSNERATVITKETGPDNGYEFKFVTWTGGFKGSTNRWWFFESGLKYITITVERETVKAAPAKRKAPRGAQAYKGNGKHKWEGVTKETQRLRVPGGWLYKMDNDCDITITFVPVPTAVGYVV